MNPRELLLGSFHAAVSAADPLRVLPIHLPPRSFPLPKGRTLAVGAGKAAAAMAMAVEQHWPEHAPLDGFVLTRYGHGLPLERIRVIEAGHPLPDEQGEQGAQTILAAAQKLGRDDLLLCLFSGGGSSLLTLPAPGIPLNDLRNITSQLLRCGATIQEINTVRKHLSVILGGRLAASCQAAVRALIISDVIGDDPTHIASGPCAPDPTTYADALAVLRYHEIKAPASVNNLLTAGAQGRLDETPKPGDAAFDRTENRVIATARGSLLAAVEYFRSRQIPAVLLGDSVTGEAREAARVFAALAKEVRQYAQPWKPPIALLSGGETTVTLRPQSEAAGRNTSERGSGPKGGRNTEFLLSLAIELDGMQGIHAIACDTDGVDGTGDNAGGILQPDSLCRAQQRGIDAHALLARNNAYIFFQSLGDLIVTGPTRTNVNDYRAILVW